MLDTDESTPVKKFVRGYCALCTAHCATVATVAFASGGALLAVGVTLFFSAPTTERDVARTPKVRVVPAVSTRSAGLSLRSTW